ncbi:MAG: heavy metal translocating P-type ATPase [Flavobacteriales bacterium]|nr:heavy metal translocating P-type ATPase [Flavobacteriales bacterium]
MARTYPITGMTCPSCVAAVQHALAKHPSVQLATVTLDPPEAVVSLSAPVPPGELQALLPPKYRIGPLLGPKALVIATLEEESRSLLTTYKPLLLVFTFITTIAVLTSLGEGRLDGMRAMRHFMAGFFLVFAFFKLLDLRGFASSYAMYDLLAMRLPVYGFTYPFIELGLGVAYLLNWWPMVTNAATLVVMGFSLVGVLRAVLNKQKIQCACLGTGFNLPMSTVTVVEDLLMVVMAAAMLGM